jgi:hypothetical protein
LANTPDPTPDRSEETAMSGHDHQGDCGYDYNSSWDYNECHKPRKPRRRHRRRYEGCWDYNSWS